MLPSPETYFTPYQSFNPFSTYHNYNCFTASVDQDQTAHNMQPDLGSTLSTVIKLCKQKQPWNCNYCGHISRIKMYDKFIWHCKG